MASTDWPCMLDAQRRQSTVWRPGLAMVDICCFGPALIPGDVMAISPKSGGGDVRLFDHEAGCLGDDRAGPCAML
jgi:hypothetical protein